MQELNPLSDVKKKIEWEINICSTLAPKLSLIGGKPDHDWCINEILFPMSKMLDGKRNIRLTLAPNTIVYKLPFLILPMWNSRFGTSFFFSKKKKKKKKMHFFFFFFFFADAKSWGCGLYTGAVYTTLITVSMKVEGRYIFMKSKICVKFVYSSIR